MNVYLACDLVRGNLYDKAVYLRKTRVSATICDTKKAEGSVIYPSQRQS